MGGKRGTQVTSTENGSALRRPKAPVACVVCKSRRIRCSGTAPCQACIALNTECIIDETLDGRRKVALTRKLDELIHHKWILEGLLICLRYSRGSSMIDLLDKVNVNVPLKSLAAAVSANLSKTELLPDMQLRASEIRQEIASYIIGFVQSEDDALIKPPKHCVPFESHKCETHSPDGAASLMGLASTTAAPHPISSREGEEFSNVHERPDGLYMGPVLDLWDGQDMVTMSPSGYDAAPYRQDLGLEDIMRFLRTTQSPHARGTSFDHSQSTDPESESGMLTGLASDPNVHVLEPFNMDHVALTAASVLETPSKSRKRPLSTSITVPPCAAPPYPGSRQSFSFQKSPDGAGCRRLSTASSTLCVSHEPSPEVDMCIHHWPELPQPARPIAMHLALPRIELNQTPMSCAITSYLDLARSMLSQGTPIEEVFGPERPMVDLFFRPRKPSDSHSACHFAAELCTRIKGMDGAAKLGITVMFVHLLRWMILSSRENYQKIPEMYQPTMTQIRIPHSAEIEFCPFPQLRDALCGWNRDFLPAVASNIRCNWPYGVETCIEQDEKTGNIVLSEAFSRHIFIPNNWTIKSGVYDTFPECRGLLKTRV